MPVVLKSVSLGAPGRKRKYRIQAVERLNCRLLIYAEHRRVLRRVQIEPDDVGCFVLEVGIVTAHVPIEPVWLQSGLRQNPLHRGVAQAQIGGQLTAGPMRAAIRRFLLDAACHASLHRCRRCSRSASFVPWLQTVDSALFEPRFPQSNCLS